MSDLRPAIFGINTALILLSLAAIVCRIGRRIGLAGSFGWHDALVTLAVVCATIFSILQMVSTRYGLGLPNPVVPQANMKPIMKLVVASRIFYFICNWSVKHSLLIFYTELTIDLWPRRSIYLMHAIAFAFGCTCIGTTIFECVPMQRIWDSGIAGRCINMTDFNYFNSCFMLATDIVLYAMPLVFTWNLHLRRPQRIGVNVLFALGIFVLGASGARIYCVYAQAKDPDFTYKFAATMICAVVENHLAIIVACAPSIKVVLLSKCPNFAAKFENMASKESQKQTDFKSSGITVDLEAAFPVKEPSVELMRPVSGRALTDDSKRSKESRVVKWWRAPSSWDVNTAGRVIP